MARLRASLLMLEDGVVLALHSSSTGCRTARARRPIARWGLQIRQVQKAARYSAVGFSADLLICDRRHADEACITRLNFRAEARRRGRSGAAPHAAKI